MNRGSISVLAIAWMALACASTAPEPASPSPGAGTESEAAEVPREGEAEDLRRKSGPESASGAAPSEEPTELSVLKNTLRWRTASEVDNFGFDVYRGDNEEGPFERLTAEPIPGAVTTDEPQQYVFEDDTIEPGRVYWYYVESISLAGVREKFTPVFASKPKGGPPASDED